ncbi:helix-turn-helix domain-containing protein [Streptomyces sp. NPDC056632]|uniref:helix-turn-helix domain-containing protein n=1 Tax=Streptomyces sp. NPDC056632 TaxID=3345884 RepID=UPI0036B62287
MDAANGLAGLLRTLKERSGLSYGALAKRLHVSTSTLHRYCNGDAVPAEFAPVERLGRLCGASREELVELHRAWIVADEARKRGRADTAPAGAAAAADGAGVADGVADGDGDGETVGSSPVPAEAPVAEAQGVSAAEPVVLVSGVPEGASRNRIKGALAAAAIVALAVPVAYLVGRVADDGGAATGNGAPSAASPAPLSAGISSYNWAAPCGQYYVLDQPPGNVPPPPTPQDARGWARALGGIDGGHMQLQLTVTGRTQAPVVLTALHVRVVERGKPLDRDAYSMGDGCGSGITPQTFDVDLDAPRPYLKPVAGQDGDRLVPAKDFPYKVATGDPQVLNLDVHTEEHVASWYLELDWSSGAEHGTVRVDDGGEPFRTSAVEGRPTYGYWPDKGEWVTQQ